MNTSQTYDDIQKKPGIFDSSAKKKTAESKQREMLLNHIYSIIDKREPMRNESLKHLLIENSERISESDMAKI